MQICDDPTVCEENRTASQVWGAVGGTGVLLAAGGTLLFAYGTRLMISDLASNGTTINDTTSIVAMTAGGISAIGGALFVGSYVSDSLRPVLRQ